jgi:5-methylcytosine-specific restriction enzyme subunit McrC
MHYGSGTVGRNQSGQRAARSKPQRARTRGKGPRAGWLLQRVTPIEYHPGRLPEILYTRLNAHYRPIVELAKYILRSTSFELGHGPVRSSAFLVDMNKVFENFVVVALREALRSVPGALEQGVRHRIWLGQAETVPLQPDFSWWVGNQCCFVGDVKYKRATGTDVPNADVYQLLAYTVATDLPSGLLIYAAGERDPNTLDVVHMKKQLRVVTLNLEQAPEVILDQVGAIAATIREQSSADQRWHLHEAAS